MATEFPNPCRAQYGKNPDRCYRPHGHDGPHWNMYGCTWADDQ